MLCVKIYTQSCQAELVSASFFFEPHRHIELVCALRQAQDDRFVDLFFYNKALCLEIDYIAL